jgi:hypothetical protein
MEALAAGVPVVTGDCGYTPAAAHLDLCRSLLSWGGRSGPP